MSNDKILRPNGQSAVVVVFADSALPSLRVLKPGYRHCMVAVQSEGHWQVMDPLSNITEITHLGQVHPEDVLNAFRTGGLDAVMVQRAPPMMAIMPVAPFTCVEAVKRVIGLRDRRVVTPWQLRKTLRHRTEKKRARA